MPSWNIHLAIAKRISEKYEVEENAFLFASLVPDMTKNRKETHFLTNKKYENIKSATKIDLDKFLKTYKNNLNNSFILGYYAHLLSDYFYNTKVFTLKFITDKDENVIGIKTKKNKSIYANMDKIKFIKHKDFENYGAYLNELEIVNVPKLSEELKKDYLLINSDVLTEEELIKKINYLNNEFKNEYRLSLFQKLFGIHYVLFNKREYDTMFNGCIRFIESEFDKLGIIRKK